MAKKKKRHEKSIAEYDPQEARLRTSSGNQYHIGDGVHRLTAWAQRSVMGVDQYGRRTR